eukprot:gene10727-11909_t
MLSTLQQPTTTNIASSWWPFGMNILSSWPLGNDVLMKQQHMAPKPADPNPLTKVQVRRETESFKKNWHHDMPSSLVSDLSWEQDATLTEQLDGLTNNPSFITGNSPGTARFDRTTPVWKFAVQSVANKTDLHIMRQAVAIRIMQMVANKEERDPMIKWVFSTDAEGLQRVAIGSLNGTKSEHQDEQNNVILDHAVVSAFASMYRVAARGGELGELPPYEQYVYFIDKNFETVELLPVYNAVFLQDDLRFMVELHTALYPQDHVRTNDKDVRLVNSIRVYQRCLYALQHDGAPDNTACVSHDAMRNTNEMYTKTVQETFAHTLQDTMNNYYRLFNSAGISQSSFDEHQIAVWQVFIDRYHLPPLTANEPDAYRDHVLQHLTLSNHFENDYVETDSIPISRTVREIRSNIVFMMQEVQLRALQLKTNLNGLSSEAKTVVQAALVADIYKEHVAGSVVAHQLMIGQASGDGTGRSVQGALRLSEVVDRTDVAARNMRVMQDAGGTIEPSVMSKELAQVDHASPTAIAQVGHILQKHGVLLLAAGQEESDATIEQTNEQASEQTNQQAHEQTNQQAHEQTNQQAHEQTNEQASEQTNEQASEQTNQQAHEQTNQQPGEQTDTGTSFGTFRLADGSTMNITEKSVQSNNIVSEKVLPTEEQTAQGLSARDKVGLAAGMGTTMLALIVGLCRRAHTVDDEFRTVMGALFVFVLQTMKTTAMPVDSGHTTMRRSLHRKRARNNRLISRHKQHASRRNSRSPPQSQQGGDQLASKTGMQTKTANPNITPLMTALDHFYKRIAPVHNASRRHKKDNNSRSSSRNKSHNASRRLHNVDKSQLLRRLLQATEILALIANWPTVFPVRKWLHLVRFFNHTIAKSSPLAKQLSNNNTPLLPPQAVTQCVASRVTTVMDAHARQHVRKAYSMLKRHQAADGSVFAKLVVLAQIHVPRPILSSLPEH